MRGYPNKPKQSYKRKSSPPSTLPQPRRSPSLPRRPSKTRSQTHNPSLPPTPEPIQDHSWLWLRSFFPLALDRLAKDTKAVERFRQGKVDSAQTLLRLLLVYLTSDFSLADTAAWAARTRLADLTDEALRQRFRGCVAFLFALLSSFLPKRLKTSCVPGKALRLIDGSNVSSPGCLGSEWRLHLTYDPFARSFVGLQLTTDKGAECLARGVFGAGDLVMGDRGLTYAKDIQEAFCRGAYHLGRVYLKHLPLWARREEGEQEDKKLDLLAARRRADAGQLGTKVLVPYRKEEAVEARLVLRPLPPEAAARARQKLKKKAVKKQRGLTQEALKWAGYLCLLTTLPEEVASDEAVCEWYRVRWQIELFIKRCKSVMGLSKLKKTKAGLAQVHLLGKMLLCAMVEQQREGYERKEVSPVSEWKLWVVYRMEIVLAVYGRATVEERMARSEETEQRLRERPRKRKGALPLIQQAHDAIQSL